MHSRQSWRGAQGLRPCRVRRFEEERQRLGYDYSVGAGLVASSCQRSKQSFTTRTIRIDGSFKCARAVRVQPRLPDLMLDFGNGDFQRNVRHLERRTANLLSRVEPARNRGIAYLQKYLQPISSSSEFSSQDCRFPKNWTHYGDTSGT